MKLPLLFLLLAPNANADFKFGTWNEAPTAMIELRNTHYDFKQNKIVADVAPDSVFLTITAQDGQSIVEIKNDGSMNIQGSKDAAAVAFWKALYLSHAEICAKGFLK